MTQQRVVLVTGSNSGIGRLIVETFARAGDRVFAGMRGPEGKNAAARAELEALAGSGLSLEVLALDVTDDAQVEAAVARVIAQAGHIDVLVNNAGVSLAALSEGSSIAQVRTVFEVNYFGPLRMCRAALPHMRKRRAGLIVHMSSIGGRVTLPNTAHYGASKAALENLGEVQRYELAGFGIDVAMVEPGLFATDILDKMPRGDDRERLAEYGELADKPEHGIAIAKQMLAAGGRDAQQVADEVFRIANLPQGERPLRTLVGDDAAMLEPINAVTEPLARAMFEAFGFI